MLHSILIWFCIVLVLGIFLKRNKCQKWNIFLKTSFMTGNIVLFVTLFIMVIAFLHGADVEALTKFNMIRTIQAIKNSPIANRSNNLDKPGNIIIYYRFGCKDCEAIYSELDRLITENENVYWVATRSIIGKRLLQKYIVTEVPAGVIAVKNLLEVFDTEYFK